MNESAMESCGPLMLRAGDREFTCWQDRPEVGSHRWWIVDVNGEEHELAPAYDDDTPNRVREHLIAWMMDTRSPYT